MDTYSNSSYPESGDSSPRSREIEFENPPPGANHKVKFVCSYGGKIHPRPNDTQLSYIGGDTKILAVDRNIKFASLLSKMIALCEADNIYFKYQLPGEDLDALISVTNDDDLEHMMHEYERLYRASPKPARLRIFIFPSQNQSLDSSARSLGSDEVKSEKERFIEALNTAPQPQSQQPAGNVDFSFGLEKANAMVAQRHAQQQIVGSVPEVEEPVVVPGVEERYTGMDPMQKHIQDFQRLRLEEQQGIHRRKSDDSHSRGFAGGEYYKLPEKISSAGLFQASTVNNERPEPVYMIPAQANAYHAPVVRPMAGAPSQGYYTVQRIPSDIYREQQRQQQMYSVIPQGAVPPMAATLPPQTPAGYGMVTPANPGGIGMMTEAGYTQVAYDGGAGRQVVYAGPGGVVGAQYHAVAETQSAGALNPETGSKGIANLTQTSV